MSNRRPPTRPASMLVRSLDGARIPGGCDHCDAYQVLVADKWAPDVHSLDADHDDWCPVLARMSAES